MKQTIFNILGVSYVAFALIMATNGSTTTVDSPGNIQGSPSTMVQEDHRSDGDSKRLSRLEGRGSIQISGASSPGAKTFAAEESEDVSHGWVDLKEKQKTIKQQMAALKPNCAIVWTATWCKSCKKMKPVVAKLEKEGYTVYVMDYDKNQALASHLSVKNLPTTIIFQDRKEKGRHVGAVSVTTIKKTLKKNKKKKKPEYEVW